MFYRTVQWFLKILETHLPYDPIIPVLIYAREFKSVYQRNTCSSVLLKHYPQSTKVAIHEEIDKENLFCTDHEILFDTKD
jgi:hypothetical protein